MALSSSRPIAAAPQAVYEALTSQANAQAVADRVGGSLVEHRIEGDDARTTTTVFTVPADRLPDIAKKLLGDELTMTLTEAWSAAGADGSRTSTIDAAVKGVPVKVNGSETLSAEGTGSLLSLNGEVSSSIPFLGGKISKAAEPMLDRLLAVRCEAVERTAQ